MIRVLLLIPTLDRSGAEKQLTLLATHLPRQEFDVHVVALTRAGPYASLLKQQGIPLTVIGKRWKLDPFAYWKLRKVVADTKPDILHTWLFAANAYGRLLPLKQGSPKIVVSERCVDSWKSAWQHRLDRRLASKTARLIGNSQSVADYYRLQGFPAERIVVIPNGIDIPPETTIDQDRIRAERLRIPPGAAVIGYAGRLARQKRVLDLIWAFELVRCLRDNAYLVIAGDGPEGERLRRFAREIRAEERIRFLGHVDNVEEILGCLDLFWLASDFEGLSNSLMEAMAAGLPVVASDIPPNRELVVHEENGLLVPVGDRVGFAKAAERLLADANFARMGAASQARIQQQFSVESMSNAYAELYREVLNAPVKSSRPPNCNH